MPGFLVFIIVFGLMIFVHELGHFLAAKLCRVRVDEFGFGYPPRLAKLFTWRGTDVTLNALPFGGFVRMAEDDPSVEGGLARKGRGARALVFASGALMNALLAVALYSLTFMLGAFTPVEGPGAGIYEISVGSPAAAAGLLPGDTILAVGGETVASFEELTELIAAHKGQPVEIVVRREGLTLSPITVTPRIDYPDDQGSLGVSIYLPLERRSYPVWQAIPKGLASTGYTVQAMWVGILQAVRKEIPFEVTGPIGIYRATVEIAKTGLERLVEFAAFLSLNLALLNLLPLPALDGGRLVFVLLEWVRRGRRVPPEKEGLVHAVGMIMLIGLMVVVAVMDYRRYFG